ncbi:MAG: hypothetical protein SPF56_02450 [Bacteroidaceae bacterium]|nr:hypothetical protein [Prevotellaceae bacterium]MDY5631354.1 hypothetical protein [Bacteroidaceae bacterium]
MRIFPILSFLLAALLLGACGELDSWTTSPDAVLRFSADTLRFDTLITGYGSATQTLVAHNGAGDGVRIQSVRLGKGAESHWRVNVDGQYLYNGQGEDFEVRAKDSIYIRVFANLPETQADTIADYKDELLFTLESGVVQRVVLTGSALNVTQLRGLTYSRDTELTTQRPYHVFDSLVVAAGATLTLPAGCTLMMHDGAELIVRGTLKAEGTIDRPVVLRGDRTDRMFPYLPYDNTPNRWGGLRFTAESRDNHLLQVDLHSSDYGIRVDSLAFETLSDPVLVIENSILHNIGGPGLDLRSTRALVVGTQISNTLGNVVSVEGGDVLFVHCTLAQFYPFSANRGYALWLSNKMRVKTADVEIPLKRAHFLNCLVSGYAEDVIQGNLMEEKTGQEKINFRFENSLLRTVASDDKERFVQVRYDLKDSAEVVGEQQFKRFDVVNFLYDFAPDSLSAARGLANRDIARQYPIDRRGINRFADDNPDAGAYEGKK